MGCAARGNEGEFGFVFDGVHGVERDALEVGAVVAGWLQSGQGKLRGDVLGGKLGSASAGAAAFEQIERQKADMGANLLRIDGFGGGTGSLW